MIKERYYPQIDTITQRLQFLDSNLQGILEAKRPEIEEEVRVLMNEFNQVITFFNQIHLETDQPLLDIMPWTVKVKQILPSQSLPPLEMITPRQVSRSLSELTKKLSITLAPHERQDISFRQYHQGEKNVLLCLWDIVKEEKNNIGKETPQQETEAKTSESEPTDSGEKQTAPNNISHWEELLFAFTGYAIEEALLANIREHNTEYTWNRDELVRALMETAYLMKIEGYPLALLDDLFQGEQTQHLLWGNERRHAGLVSEYQELRDSNILSNYYLNTLLEDGGVEKLVRAGRIPIISVLEKVTYDHRGISQKPQKSTRQTVSIGFPPRDFSRFSNVMLRADEQSLLQARFKNDLEKEVGFSHVIQVNSTGKIEYGKVLQKRILQELNRMEEEGLISKEQMNSLAKSFYESNTENIKIGPDGTIKISRKKTGKRVEQPKPESDDYIVATYAFEHLLTEVYRTDGLTGKEAEDALIKIFVDYFSDADERKNKLAESAEYFAQVTASKRLKTIFLPDFEGFATSLQERINEFLRLPLSEKDRKAKEILDGSQS